MDKELEFLEKERDFYYEGDWNKMLLSLKKNAHNYSTPPDLKKKQMDAVEKIEIYLGIRPKDGYRNLYGKCRVPANMSPDDLKNALSSLNSLYETESQKSEEDLSLENWDLYPAIVAIKEILYLIYKNEKFLQNRYSRNSYKDSEYIPLESMGIPEIKQ